MRGREKDPQLYNLVSIGRYFFANPAIWLRPALRWRVCKKILNLMPKIFAKSAISFSSTHLYSHPRILCEPSSLKITESSVFHIRLVLEEFLLFHHPSSIRPSKSNMPLKNVEKKQQTCWVTQYLWLIQQQLALMSIFQTFSSILFISGSF